MPAAAFGLSSDEARTQLRAKGIECSVDAFADSIRRGDAAVVNLFLDAGIDVNSVDRTGRPILVVAAGHANVPILIALIDRGADVNIRQTGHSAFSWPEAVALPMDKA